MSQPEDASPSNSPAPSPGIARLQWFGQRAVVIVLLTLLALNLHEQFVDPLVRQGWKLKVMVVLIPLGVTGAAALLMAWLLAWNRRRGR